MGAKRVSRCKRSAGGGWINEWTHEEGDNYVSHIAGVSPSHSKWRRTALFLLGLNFGVDAVTSAVGMRDARRAKEKETSPGVGGGGRCKATCRKKKEAAKWTKEEEKKRNPGSSRTMKLQDDDS